MPIRTFATWYISIIESPIAAAGASLTKRLETLRNDRGCTWDELLKEQLDRAKRDPVFLSNAKSRAQPLAIERGQLDR